MISPYRDYLDLLSVFFPSGEHTLLMAICDNTVPVPPLGKIILRTAHDFTTCNIRLTTVPTISVFKISFSELFPF